jgi:hypothetical protein
LLLMFHYNGACAARNQTFAPFLVVTLVRTDARTVEEHMAPSQNNVDVLLPLLVGAATTACTIVIHALALMTIVHYVRREHRLGLAGVRFWKDVSIVAGITMLALTAHLVEIAAWAWVFSQCGPFSDFGTAFYHSALNYTTLGDADTTMSPSWKLLGPLEAADGMLMFGVSTAMLFTVIQRLLQTRFSSERA